MFHDNKPLSILHDKSINPKFDHYLHLHANLIDVKKQKKTAIKELKKKLCIIRYLLASGVTCDVKLINPTTAGAVILHPSPTRKENDLATATHSWRNRRGQRADDPSLQRLRTNDGSPARPRPRPRPRPVSGSVRVRTNPLQPALRPKATARTQNPKPPHRIASHHAASSSSSTTAAPSRSPFFLLPDLVRSHHHHPAASLAPPPLIRRRVAVPFVISSAVAAAGVVSCCCTDQHRWGESDEMR